MKMHASPDCDKTEELLQEVEVFPEQKNTCSYCIICDRELYLYRLTLIKSVKKLEWLINVSTKLIMGFVVWIKTVIRNISTSLDTPEWNERVVYCLWIQYEDNGQVIRPPYFWNSFTNLYPGL